jgi:hypothetical protein
MKKRRPKPSVEREKFFRVLEREFPGLLSEKELRNINSTEATGYHSYTDAAECLGISERHMDRVFCRSPMWEIAIADKYCIRLGRHPATVWGAQFYVGVNRKTRYPEVEYPEVENG